MKLKELSELVGGTLIGSSNPSIKRVASISDAKAGDLLFVLEDKFLLPAIASPASALVFSHALNKNINLQNKPAILVKNPRLAMAKILPAFSAKKTLPKGIHKTAIVPSSCKIGKEVSIGAYVVLGEKVEIADKTVIYPFAFIGDKVKIGNNCLIYSHVSIEEDTLIGQRVILHAGCRIGFDGFGFVKEEERHIKIPQVGHVVIEDDAEIYANTCIARGALGSTIIGAGTKIDSLCQIAHNCQIGQNNILAALVGMSGSTTVGNGVYIGGFAGFKGHLTVGDNAVIAAKAGVTKDVPANTVVSGFPAQEHRKEMALQASLRKIAKTSPTVPPKA